MARPRSEERRDSIIAAAITVIASQGLAAPTATIAKEAGISNGSLFTYFDTKAELLNALYLELRGEIASAALQDVPVNRDIRSQMLQIWRNWLHWTTASPEKRTALKHLCVSEDITPDTHEAVTQVTAEITAYIDRCRKTGPMRDEPLEFVGALINAMVETTIDFIIADPANAERHSMAAFEATWRAIA